MRTLFRAKLPKQLVTKENIRRGIWNSCSARAWNTSCGSYSCFYFYWF